MVAHEFGYHLRMVSYEPVQFNLVQLIDPTE